MQKHEEIKYEVPKIINKEKTTQELKSASSDII